MKILTSFSTSVLLLTVCLCSSLQNGAAAASSKLSPVKIHHLAFDPQTQAHNLHLSHEGQEHHFELRKKSADQIALHPSLTIAEAYEDENGQLVVENWTPDDLTLEAADNVYIDPKGHATVRIEKSATGQHLISGIMKDFSVIHDGNDHFAKTHENRPATDNLKVPSGVNLTSSSSSRSDDFDKNVNQQLKESTSNENIVELLLFADKDLSDFFGQDRRRLLNYYTMVMYDNNLRYKTLPNVKISFILSGLVLTSNTGAQPYIEKTRNEKGQADFNKILVEFGKWLYENKSKFPKFDMATIGIRTECTWGGGLAWMSAVCGVDEGGRQNYNVFVFTDIGDYSSPVFLTHESGHNVGAPHDDDDSVKEECNNVRGYIMSGGTQELQYFFSPCSDKFIKKTVEHSDKNCLRRIDNERPARVDFSNPAAPSMDDVCRRKMNNQKAYVASEDQNNCKLLKCRAPTSDGGTVFSDTHYLIDNMICTAGGNVQGRCFRGRCRKQGWLLKHVESGLCMASDSQFTHWTSYKLVQCPRSGTPLDRFVLDTGKTGLTLATPYSQVVDGKQENDDKCAWTGASDDDRILAWSDRCGDYSNPWHGWEKVKLQNNYYYFLIKHKVTGRCLKPEEGKAGSVVLAYKNCDTNDNNMKWTQTRQT